MSVEKLWHRKLGFIGVAIALALLLSALAFISIRQNRSNLYDSDRTVSKRSLNLADNLVKKFLLSDSNPSNGLLDKAVVTVTRSPPPWGTPEDVRIFEFDSWGERWVLKTWSDTKFLSPSSLVWREKDNDSWVETPQTSCFVRGNVKGTSNKSDAALNICQGLSGVIQLDHLVFLIEPFSNVSDQSEKNSRTKDLFSAVPYAGTDQKRHVIQLVSQFRNILAENSPKREDHHRESERIHVSKETGSSYLTRHNNTLAFTDLQTTYVRPKRFIYSRRHTIEVMVVVDNKMAHYHGKHVDQYVLTLMSVVSLIFRDSSVGNNIDIAVVEVVKPEGKSFAPKKTYENYAGRSGKSAEEMLKMFCKWHKHRLKYDADHPHRYDTALLITRENICRNPYTQRCDTLGLAELGTMCSRYASCAIVQDNGLSAAFTIAHELGHLLNMPHDNDEKCSPFREKESFKQMNVMSRMLDHNTLPWIWSNCSKYYLTEYFQAGLGDCLEDEPWSNKIKEDNIDVTLAGKLFSATQQCQYVFGKTSSICPYMPKCKRLWCTTTLDEKEGCRTQHMPWADGTPCDRNRWCLRGECEPKNRAELEKIDGQWGAWELWTSCSRSCGVGVRKSERFCDSPKPRYGGRFCIGERVRYESCKILDCPGGEIDFRSKQCRQFNGKNFGLPDIPENVMWIPKYADRREDSCKLFCQAHNSGFSYQLKEKVEDGTPCGPDSYDICVGGKCRVAGCDYVLNSTLKDDWCGVCNGDNSTCQLLTGSLSDVQPWGYSDIILIPEGAARISIVQKAYHDNPADDNYLALVDYETGDYLLNGNWVVTPFEKMVEFGGSLLEYTGSNQPIERINSTKPLKKKLLVQILSVGKLFPPFVSYSFSKSDQDAAPPYLWKLGTWTKCSRPCIGNSEQIPYCIRGDTNARVADHLCEENEKPNRRMKACSLECSVHWSYTEWSSCKWDESKRCVKTRNIDVCVTSAKTPVSVQRCDDLTPSTEMECHKKECPLWTFGEWSPCDCASGSSSSIQMRLHACYMNNRPVNDWECKGLEKPSEERSCPCWFVGNWSSECYKEESETTLELRRRHEAVYSKISLLKGRSSSEDIFDSRALASPYLQKAFVYDDPYIPQDTCPWGKKRRKVTCGSPDKPNPEERCDLKVKPSEVSLCKINCQIRQSTNYEPILPPIIMSTPIPQYNSHYQNIIPSLASNQRKKNAKVSTLENNFAEPKGFSHGGFIKGGRKNLPEVGNDLLNTLPTNTNSKYNKISYPNQIHQRPLKKKFEEVDSGEEEHNDLIKGRLDPDHHLWQTGQWEKCSKKCGTGQRKRVIHCGGDNRFCPFYLRPKDMEKCNEYPCTEWSLSGWGSCIASKRNNCRGKKHRTVLCQNEEERTVNSKLCLAEDRPQSVTTCKLACDRTKRLNKRYRWRKKPWTMVKGRTKPI